MTRWMLSNGNGWDAFPASEEELVHGLRQIDALARREGRPRLAVLAADADTEDAPYLSIGVGGEVSVLVYEGEQGQGGYSKGAARCDASSPVFFAYGTGSTEFLGCMAVPMQQAFEAATEFFRTGKRPGCVDWEDL